jgi:catechol 2,3-dioxygenase-like lactoylglutathione lyase family enzyme
VISGLDHVQVAAPPGCEAQARRFYGHLLGLVELAKPSRLRSRGGVWFTLGDSELHIGIERDFRAARKAHPALAASSRQALDELAARLQESGHAVIWDSELPAVKRFFTHDPFGNRLELVARESGAV